MQFFSERYGYVSISDVLVHEEITQEIQNAICSCYDNLLNRFCCYASGHNQSVRQSYARDGQEKLEKYIWQYFLNQRIAEYNNTYYRTLIPNIITDRRTPWYSVLDLIEATIDFLRDYDKFTLDSKVADDFIGELNQEFKRLNFAYRIVADQVIDITSEEEMGSVDQAIKESPSNIQMHLSKAVEMYAQKPEGDYRNSIKESISAVEAYCREKTGDKDFGDALKNLKKNGLIIPPVLETAFEKLYAYTNQPTTGIRHALMDETEIYTPKAEEAMFMLVSCSAFINYLNRKC